MANVGSMKHLCRMAGPPFARLGGALGLSLLAHAGALATLVWALRDEGAASVSRQKGGITVSLRTVPAPAKVQAGRKASLEPPGPTKRNEANVPQPVRVASVTAEALKRTSLTRPVSVEASENVHPARTPAPPPEQTAAPAPSAQPQVDGGAASSEVSPPAGQPPAAPMPAMAASKPGAQFANLFAPLTTRPMGRGRWQTAPRPAIPLDAQMQREQALQGLRQSLQARMMSMQGVLAQTPLADRCEVRTDLERRLAQVRCVHSADEARLWAMLAGIATAGTVPAEAAGPMCLQAQAHQIDWQDCQKQGLLARQADSVHP